jgi:hypothetical protein
MIPSKYLFPVIALVLVWAGSLFAVYNYSNSETNRPTQTVLMNALNEELDLVSQMVSDLGAADNPDETLEQLATLKVINQLWLNQLSKSLVRVSGGRLIQCFIRYEVTPGQANLLKQRKKEQSLALDIIEYGTGLSYEDVKLVINSDTIASENGRFRASVPTVKKGRHLIEAEILITNPLTGLATTRKSYFSYYVE